MEISYHYEVFSVTELTVYVSCPKEFFCRQSLRITIFHTTTGWISSCWHLCIVQELSHSNLPSCNQSHGMDSIHLNIKKEISFHWQVCFFFSQNGRIHFTLQILGVFSSQERGIFICVVIVYPKSFQPTLNTSHDECWTSTSRHIEFQHPQLFRVTWIRKFPNYHVIMLNVQTITSTLPSELPSHIGPKQQRTLFGL